MGIPRLISLLEPYSTLTPLSGQEVVVDGPAFAYHVYHLCLGSRSYVRRPFEAAPSYAEIGATAIQWLDGLQDGGATIKKVYFDGFLPPSKFETRLVRLVSTTQRMSNYYYSNQIVHIPTSQTRTTNSIYNNASVPARLSALPPPPFHVAAVIEALQESIQYKEMTHVVPGEADLYCSKYLSQNGGIVLTGDSDLLVHALGPAGQVGFFKDLSMSGSEVLQIRTYWPSAIAKRLALPTPHGLLSLAFEMTMDHHGALTKLLADAKDFKATQTHKAMFDDFQKEYHALMNELDLGSCPSHAASLFQRLDPRISEYILQFPCLAELAGQETPSHSVSTPHVFLPFLLDNPELTNAWEMSTSVRQLAYGLINFVVPENMQQKTAFEHKKQKNKSQGRELLLATVSEIPEACAAIVKLFAQIQQRLPEISNRDIWTAVAVHQDVEWANAHSKESASEVAKRKFLDGNFGKASAWHIIQFFAQIQGSYYSFRILKQITSLVIACAPESGLPESVVQLQQQLADLPNLAQLQTLSEVVSIVQLLEKIFPVIHDMLGIQNQSLPATLGDAKRAVKRKRKQERQTSMKSRTKSSNPFDVLDVE